MTDFPIPEIENVRRYPIKTEKPPMYEAYGSIREMQEAKGMIEKGAPLWDYGITSESGVNLPFGVSAESGWLPPYPAIDFSKIRVYNSFEEATKATEALRFPPNGDGIRCLCDGEELCQAHYLKLKQEHKNTDRACDFVGRAADL